MSDNKKGFWKNFSLKIFLLIAIYMFVATMVVECIWNLIVKDPVSALTTTSALEHRGFVAIIAGLLIYLFYLLMKRKFPDPASSGTVNHP